jgi:acetylcholinesterase
MGSRFLFCFLLQLLSASSLPTSLETRDESPPIVDLGYAKYEGVRLSAGVDQFLGMRYAAPPLGDLRFRGPRDPIPNFSVQSASSVSRNAFTPPFSF